MQQAGAVPPLLVGRDSALAALQHRLQAALRGQGALVLISGDAGTGKTALALASGVRARAVGLAFGVGRCYEGRVVETYAPWQDMLADLQGSGALSPAVLPNPFGGAPPVHTAYELMQAVVTLLRSATAERPLMLLLDDVHLAGQDSLDLLDVVTRHLERLPLLLLVTYRSEGAPEQHLLTDYLPRLQHDRPVETIRLGELSVADTALLVEAMLGNCSAELATYLHARADGNPLFLVELLRDLVERQLLSTDDADRLLPPTRSVEVPILLHQVIAARLARLDGEVNALLDVAAVAGQEWELAVVEGTLGWPEAALLGPLERALAAHVLAPAPGRGERYCFTHSLLHEVVYDRQPARRRRRLHGQAAALLAGRAPLAAHAAALAYHCARAEQWEQAARYYIVAGDAARDHLAGHSALRFYEQALAAQDASGQTGADAGAALYERLGHAHLLLSRLTAAEDAFSRMLSAARATGDRSAAGQALVWLSFMATRLYRLDAASATAEEALRMAEQAGDRPLLVLSHWNLGQVLKSVSEPDLATRHNERATQLAREVGQPRLLSWCLFNQAMLANWRGQYARAALGAGEALALARAGHDARAIGGDYWQLGLAQGEMGRYVPARQALQAGLDHAEQSGKRYFLVKLLNTMGWLYGELGDSETASRWNERALEACRRDDVDPITEARRYSLLNLASDELQRGRPDGAAAYMRRFEGLLEHSEYARLRYFNRYQLLQAELAILRGEFAAALHRSAEAAELATSKGMRKNLAKSRLLSGRALLALDRPEEATSCLARAVALADVMGHGSLRWQGRWWLGQARAALGQRTLAAARFRQALDQIVALAAELDDDGQRDRFLVAPITSQVAAAVAALEAGPRVSAPASLPDHLTAREVEVLRLIAAGRSNGEIAGALIISLNTVLRYVSHIFAKTGSGNRTAAALYAHRHRLVS